MAVRLTFVRHGETEFNAENRLRGWMDPPLNLKGMQASRHAAMQLHGRKEMVYSSDLLRAKQTAWAIGGCVLVSELRPWHVGVFAGAPGAVVHPVLMRYARYGANVAVPFGESWNKFLDRYLGFLSSLTADSILVTHYRNCKVAQAWRGGRELDWSVLDRDDISTGSVFTLERP